jgi:hypothetical protein
VTFFFLDQQVAELPPLGLGKDNIDFFTALRYSMPEDERAANVPGAGACR